MRKLDFDSLFFEKNLSTNSDSGGLFVLYISNESIYSQQQAEKLESSQVNFKQKNINLKIISNDTNSQIKAYLYSYLTNLKEPQQAIIIANSAGEILWYKIEINFKDLSESILDFSQNYRTSQKNTKLFAWGNIIPENGDYMCVDCGYILSVGAGLEFEQGMSFPTCGVCQSGEPDSPTGSFEPFWQKM